MYLIEIERIYAGVCLLFLPPYSPDLNPIEHAFACVKSWLRRHYERCQQSEDPELILYEACTEVTAAKACGWFRNCGYRV
ncbi:hypothetical protein SISNIDRAFT_420153 [Sistotremastrum niveocremeum HHB9708]|uniref:Tc1-like transposase DDE domain-containing protein n=1 Tax=Sistotremastrum niveocremeum HHB9708 TaxID=1314777 RepID=A0A164MTA3_9AGAM|nr:hypothetical protein SISNIDRAFT_420153 [Sistotremastrum niveocremeum HHB9708]